MKYLIAILTIVSSMAGVEQLNAQALRISPGDTVVYIASMSSFNESSSGVAQFITITNNSGQNDTICWKVAQLTMDSAWASMSLCDPVNCYLFYGDVTNGTTHRDAVPADSSISVDFTSTPQCVADTGYFQALFWLKNDSAASATNLLYIPVYTGVCGTAGVQQIQASQFNIYPNPVSSNVNIEGLQNSTNVQISVYDILGNLVLRKNIAQPGANVSIGTGGLAQGVYLLSVESDGVNLFTRRIEKLD